MRNAIEMDKYNTIQYYSEYSAVCVNVDNFPGLLRAIGRKRVVGTYQIAPFVITPSASVNISRALLSSCPFPVTRLEFGNTR